MEETGDENLNYADSNDYLKNEDFKEVKTDDDNEKEDIEGNFVNNNDKNSQNDSDDEGWNLLINQDGIKHVSIDKVPTIFYCRSYSEDETPPAPPPSPNFDTYF